MTKLKAILDNKMTWTAIGMFAGTMFGDKAAMIVGALGNLVMTAI
jgi:hypothetical protein